MGTLTFQAIELAQALQQYKSISNTARNLYLSEPALSKKFRRIERELGVPLLRRTTGGSTLTEAGFLLADKGTELLRMRDDLLAQLEQVGKRVPEPQEVLHLGISECYANTLLSVLLPRFLQQHPNLRLDLLTQPTDTLERYCLDGRVDLILTQKEACDSRLAGEALCAEQTRVYLSPNLASDPYLQPFFAAGHIKLRQLHTYPYVQIQGQERFSQYARQFFQEAGFVPKTVLASENWKTLLMFLENNSGYTVMPDFFAQGTDLLSLDLDSRLSATRHLMLGYLRHRKLPESCRDFIQLARKSFRTAGNPDLP